MEGTESEMVGELALLKASLEASGFFVTGQSVLGKKYFKLNKANFLALIGTSPGQLWQFPNDQLEDSESPKHDPTWPSSDGKASAKKGPKGKINLALALYLTLLWQTYLAERKYIVANQVLSELNAFQNGKVSQAQVLDFLSKLPPTQ